MLLWRVSPNEPSPFRLHHAPSRLAKSPGGWSDYCNAGRAVCKGKSDEIARRVPHNRHFAPGPAILVTTPNSQDRCIVIGTNGSRRPRLGGQMPRERLCFAGNAGCRNCARSPRWGNRESAQRWVTAFMTDASEGREKSLPRKCRQDMAGIWGWRTIKPPGD